MDIQERVPFGTSHDRLQRVNHLLISHEEFVTCMFIYHFMSKTKVYGSHLKLKDLKIVPESLVIKTIRYLVLNSSFLDPTL